MNDLLIGLLMTDEIETIARDAPLLEAAQRLSDEVPSSILIVDENSKLVGIITVNDIVDAAAEQQNLAAITVEEYMSTDLETASPNDSVARTADIMDEYNIHHVPVTDSDNTVLGIISTADLTRYLSGDTPE